MTSSTPPSSSLSSYVWLKRLAVAVTMVVARESQSVVAWTSTPSKAARTPSTTPSFVSSTPSSSSSSSWSLAAARRVAVAEPTTEQETDRRTRRSSNDEEDRGDGHDDDDHDDLEYLMDLSVSRELDDPFHILLLQSTFEKPKITVTYVSGSLEYVLNMPNKEATELSQFAKAEGFACLGTWTREECLSLGKQLQNRDLVCRVVPFCAGGQRGWQAKDASSSSSSFSTSDS